MERGDKEVRKENGTFDGGEEALKQGENYVGATLSERVH